MKCGILISLQTFFGIINNLRNKRKATVFCLASRYEGLGNVILEAMACGKAVIVSDIPEFHYIVKNRAGISFKTEDALSLTQSMKDLMTSNERREMGQRGRNWVKDYTWDKIAVKYEDFLKNILEINQRNLK